MAVSLFRPLVALVVSTALCGGCAGPVHESLAHRLVKPGTSEVNLGGSAPGKAEKPSRAEVKKLKEAPRPPKPSSLGLSVEGFDKRLAAALLFETATHNAESHLQVADEYRRLGILDASMRHVDQALRVSPRFAPAHERKAQIWRDWGFPQQGLGAAYRATYFAPNSASAYNTLGTLFASLGRADDARKAYSRALRLNPSASWTLNNMCDLERRTKQLPEAEAKCRAALAIDPQMAAAHNNLALTLAANGDLDGARREFLAAGDEASAHYNMGLVQMADGDYEAAADAFETAIRLRPSFTAAKTKAHAMRLYLLTGGK